MTGIGRPFVYTLPAFEIPGSHLDQRLAVACDLSCFHEGTDVVIDLF
jgi:hypothetical protein